MSNKYDHKTQVRRDRLLNHKLSADQVTATMAALHGLAIVIANGDVNEVDVREDINAILDAEIQWYKEELSK